MAALDLKRKLAILSDAAKYDASCASSGGTKRDSLGGKGVGSVDGGMGICHAYAPDGRCISLLKILLTNFCVYDCAYCVNRVSSNTTRARFTVEEVCDLTLGFYKRNYIEGLFLSSGIIRTADYTMEEMVRVDLVLLHEPVERRAVFFPVVLADRACLGQRQLEQVRDIKRHLVADAVVIAAEIGGAWIARR